MDHQSVGWWRKHGRRFTCRASALSPRGGSYSKRHLAQYAKHQTHPVLAVDHGGGKSSWNISDGSTTVKARAAAGKSVYGYVVPASAFNKTENKPGGCWLLTTMFVSVPAAVTALVMIVHNKGENA
jgi:hypothetical protein